MTAAATIQGYTPAVMWIDEELVPWDEESEDEELDEGQSLDHYTCEDCAPTTALCGVDLTGSTLVVFEASPRVCVVCLHMNVCPKCGDELEPIA